MYLMIEDDIHDGLIDPPPQKMIVDGQGTMIKAVELSDVLKPQYRKCKSCAARKRCSRVQKRKGVILDVDCVIEKEALEVLLTRLTLDGVTTQDEMLVFPLVRNTFQLIRLYELETVIDFNKILRDPDHMKMFKDISSITTKVETQQLKYLKELMATRKEDQKKSIHNINTSKTFDLAKKLQEKKKIANKESQSN